MIAYYGTTSHRMCSEATGHRCQEPSGRACIEAPCPQPAGTFWGPMWCPDHDAERLDRISASLASILATLTPKEPTPWPHTSA